ncbi:MAG: ABC transporter substrate-binding protein [Anaerolineae bacterium]
MAQRQRLYWTGLLVGVAALMAFATASCAAAPPHPTALDSARAFPQTVFVEAPQAKTYRIGLNTEVTGTGAQIGDLSIRAARLAVEEINAAGGVNGVPLELVVRDCRSDPAVALQQYQEAMAADRLVALLGPLKSAYAVALIPAHQRATVPMIIGATNPHLTEQGDTNLFRMRPSDRITGTAMVALALDQLRAQRVALVHDADAFGTGGAEVVSAELARRAVPLVLRESYLTGTTDFETIARHVAAADVDTLLIYGTNSTDVGYLLRGLRYRGVTAHIITSPGGASAVTHNIAGDAQDGVYVATDAVLSASPEGRRFQQSFVERFGLPPDTYIAWCYDAIYLLARALAEAGPDPPRLAASLRAGPYRGAQGVYSFDSAGEGLHGVWLVRMLGGEGQPVGVYGPTGFLRGGER